MSFLTENQISLIEELIIEVRFMPYYYILHPKCVWNRYHFIKLSEKLRFHEKTLEFWIYSNVLLSQLTIKPPIFEEIFCLFSQLLFILLSAPLPSTLSCTNPWIFCKQTAENVNRRIFGPKVEVCHSVPSLSP